MRSVRTDVASEWITDGEKVRGVRYAVREKEGIRIEKLRILNEEGEKAIGKPIGQYVTLNFPCIWKCRPELFDALLRRAAKEIRTLALPMIGEKEKTLLIVGLGNRLITSDAVGPQTVDAITVTRHLKTGDRSLFDLLGSWSIAAICPGVVGQTGIETSELVREAADAVKPSLIIVIDALASKSVDRLATTLQFSDTGLAPGSGIGNRRRPLTKEALGIPVLAIGVPTIVDSASLVYDALDRAGISEENEKLDEILRNGRSFFVTLKENDVVIAEYSRLIAGAISAAFAE